MYSRFGLVLVVNHACNLRCTYCYTGAKFHRALPFAVGCRAIDRAIGSLAPGGVLELGFFGGEPLLGAEQIDAWVAYARLRAAREGVRPTFHMTTNGTLRGPVAWQLMALPDMNLSISCDGEPEVHDAHRVGVDGRGSYRAVAMTMGMLQAAGKSFNVVMVVRPDNVTRLPDGLRHLHALGVRQVSPSLDLWTSWSHDDAARLRVALREAAELWAGWLPDFDVSWFSEKAAKLAHAPAEETARCSFGAGEIAVAPSGNLYPCERLVGEDRADHPLRLAGHALDGDDFLGFAPAAARSDPSCDHCAIATACSTSCRCSNFVRTGDVSRPDGLLCLLDQDCFRETARALASRADITHFEENCHV